MAAGIHMKDLPAPKAMNAFCGRADSWGWGGTLEAMTEPWPWPQI